MKHKRLSVGLLCLGVGLATHAQESTVAAGGNASGSGGNISYSIGQTVDTNHSSPGFEVTSGVQQPYEISIELGVENNLASLHLNAYPNPTIDDLTLNVGDIETSAVLSFKLFDMHGKLIDSNRITGTSKTISMGSLPASIYFLKVIRNNKEIKTFKIIKN